MRGTADSSLLKKRQLSRMVSYARVFIRVRDVRDEPGYGKGPAKCRAHLVEGNVPVCANPAEKEIDPADGFDGQLIILALLVQVLRIPV
jgi:hypothetical protein